MKSKFSKWTNKEYSPKRRILIIILAGVLFVIIIPAILIILPYFIDSSLNIPRFMFEPVNYSVGAVFIIIGMVFSLWSIYVQYKIGKGTPALWCPPRS